jgi:ankyrin repeat protein
MSFLTEEEIDDILYCSRANELEELKPYISSLDTKYSTESAASILLTAVDAETGNNAAHYACGNGHLGRFQLLKREYWQRLTFNAYVDIIKYLLSQFSSSDPSSSSKSLLTAQNKAGNTPLHWAALNGHLPAVKLLLESGADVSILNAAGHDAVYEAEINDKNEVVDFLLKEAVGLDTGIGGTNGDEAEEEVKDDPNVMEGTMNGGVDSVKDEMEKMDIKEGSVKETGD